jgi:ATP/maltotriose-dependent transcriptional regulator MalT
MTGEYALALTSANEALELAENHHLVGEAASAADIILTIHLETENLDAANSWIARSEDLAAGVGARYARASLAVNQAIYALLRGDPERAEQCIEPYKEKHYSDPIIRQRMLYLSILARSAIARHERDRLAELAPALRSALDLRRNTGAHDFHVASYAQCLEVLGERLAAVEYVRNFVLTARRDRTEVSANLNSFLV